MKRLIKILVLISVSILLFGCGKKEDTLVMVTEAGFEPYEYVKNNEIVGVDVDIAREIAREMGKKLEIKDVAFDSIVNELNSNKADFAAAGMSITEERKKEVDFSAEYISSKQVIVVNKNNNTIKSKEDLNSKTISVQTGTVGDTYVSKNFKNAKKGYLTLPTKFSMVEPILGLDHQGKVTIRMSVNPKEIISRVELGTSSLENRIKAINSLCEAGYQVGILIAPVIMIDGWKEKYLELIQELESKLSPQSKSKVFFEVIFMTYSFVHDKINSEAFPTAMKIYDKEKMQGRGKGKYMYKQALRDDGKEFLEEQLKKYFPNNKIEYMV